MSHSWLVLPNVWLCKPIGKVALSILMSSTWANTQHVFHWIRTHIHSQTSFMSSTWANTQSTGSYDKQPDYSPVVKNLSVVPLSIGDKIACRLINTTSSHYHRDRPLERDHLPPHQTGGMRIFWCILVLLDGPLVLLQLTCPAIRIKPLSTGLDLIHHCLRIANVFCYRPRS